MNIYLGIGNVNLLPALLKQMNGFLPGDVSVQVQHQVAMSSFFSLPNKCE